MMNIEENIQFSNWLLSFAPALENVVNGVTCIREARDRLGNGLK